MDNSDNRSTNYWNGDGFATERGLYQVRFEDTSASGSTDGGYDLWSSQTTLVRTRASDNARNYRVWGTGVTMTGCRGSAPKLRGGAGSQAQLWVAKGADVTLSGCTFTDPPNAATVTFYVEPGAELRVADTRVTYGCGGERFGASATKLTAGWFLTCDR